METFERLTPLESRLYAGRFRCAGVLAVIVTLLLAALLWAFSPNRPVELARQLDNFYYGSIGADISRGLPLKVLKVLPGMFPEYLPEGAGRQDYTAFGFIQMPGRPLPIGFSIRRQFIDFAGLNCGTCHTGSVRASSDAEPIVIAGMPAIGLNLQGFFEFLFKCAADDRFNAADILATMDREGLAGPIDGLIFRYVVPVMKKELLERERQLKFLFDPGYTPFGPGRVNTFDTFKYDQFAPYYHANQQPIDPHEIYGIVDFPAVWNQAPREGLNLHWDGNNTSVRERNFSAAIGAGAKPQDIDTKRMFRVEAWLRTLPPPAYPFNIDERLAARGEAIYDEYCFDCHAFEGSAVGKVVPLDEIGTDRSRLDSYTQFLLEAQQDYTKGFWWAFTHFTKTHGYASQPLDGIWARAPYLHNGSAPTMWDLLKPARQRPRIFTRGGDIYDTKKMGFAHEVLTGSAETGFKTESGEPYAGAGFVQDAALRGNGKQGHTGRDYGTELSDDDKWALIEYLKKL